MTFYYILIYTKLENTG